MTWWRNRLQLFKAAGGNGRIWFRRSQSTGVKAIDRRARLSTARRPAPRPAGDPSIAQQVCRSRCRDWINCRTIAVDSRKTNCPPPPLPYSPCTNPSPNSHNQRPPPLLPKRPPIPPHGRLDPHPDRTTRRRLQQQQQPRRLRRLPKERLQHEAIAACQKACPIWLLAVLLLLRLIKPALHRSTARLLRHVMAQQQQQREPSVCARKRGSMHRNALNMVLWLASIGVGYIRALERQIQQHATSLTRGLVVMSCLSLRSNGFRCKFFFSSLLLAHIFSLSFSFHASALVEKKITKTNSNCFPTLGGNLCLGHPRRHVRWLLYFSSVDHKIGYRPCMALRTPATRKAVAAAAAEKVE